MLRDARHVVRIREGSIPLFLISQLLLQFIETPRQLLGQHVAPLLHCSKLGVFSSCVSYTHLVVLAHEVFGLHLELSESATAPWETKVHFQGVPLRQHTLLKNFTPDSQRLADAFQHTKAIVCWELVENLRQSTIEVDHQERVHQRPPLLKEAERHLWAIGAPLGAGHRCPTGPLHVRHCFGHVPRVLIVLLPLAKRPRPLGADHFRSAHYDWGPRCHLEKFLDTSVMPTCCLPLACSHSGVYVDLPKTLLRLGKCVAVIGQLLVGLKLLALDNGKLGLGILGPVSVERQPRLSCLQLQILFLKHGLGHLQRLRHAQQRRLQPLRQNSARPRLFQCFRLDLSVQCSACLLHLDEQPHVFCSHQNLKSCRFWFQLSISWLARLLSCALRHLLLGQFRKIASISPQFHCFGG